ncbi:MAG: peptidoglycan DD-metalloendopeptidase family protein [Oscillospiraceae bacterium]|nr:peptidoglycan DD-metalloendopeptidase family protein [Oscillospiraceae bacterium]
MPVTAHAVTQAEIDALKAQRDAIKAQRQEKQAVVEQLEAEKASVVEQKRAMDERNTYTLQQIQLNSDEIKLYDEMIADKELELINAQQLEQQQLERYRSRVRAMEENGNLNYFAMIFKSNNLGEMLTAMDDIGEIMENDQALKDAYTRARENTEEVKLEYEAYKEDIEAKQEVLREEQKELEKDIEEATKLILDLEKDLENRQAEFDAISAEEDAANAAIDKLIAQMEAERAAASVGSAGGGTASGTGSFVFPVASYVYISSRFGMRVHPITGQYKSHTGMDIASNQGTAVYACDSGTVALAGWNGGYGNCIIIDHGNGYRTLYGHLSVISVSEGQTVSQGNTIGQVGSTGNSTGPHLHLEVFKNGNRIDPEQFYSGLTISQDAGV